MYKNDCPTFIALILLTPYDSCSSADILSEEKAPVHERFTKWQLETVNREIIKSDFVVMPGSTDPNSRFKSNNKTVNAWLLGMPVATSIEEFERFLDPIERQKEADEKYKFAVENYELFSFNTCEPAGFYEYDEFTGASPDRKIVGQNGGCEFKCPSFQIYNEYLETQKLPKAYYWQIIGQLLCTGWDFLDYMPYSSPKLKQILIRIERSQHEAAIEQLKTQLSISIEEVKVLIERIKQ